MTVADIETAAQRRYFFLTPDEVRALALLEPERVLLVRYGDGRALLPANEVGAAIRRREEAGGYVRDVSFPVGDRIVNGGRLA